MKEFPLFPVAITEKDFDSNGETSHGTGALFPDGVVDIKNKSYIFDVFGQKMQGLVIEDYQMSHISSRLSREHSDMRQMKVYLMNPDITIRNFIYISYYQRRFDNMKEVIFVLARKK